MRYRWKSCECEVDETERGRIERAGIPTGYGNLTKGMEDEQTKGRVDVRKCD